MAESNHGRVEGIRIDMQMAPSFDREVMQHNLARYNELQKLRLGQANTYLETTYR